MGAAENKRYLKERYKKRVISPEKNIEEILKLFNKKLDIREIDLSEVSVAFQKATKLTFLHSLKNKQVGLSEQKIVLSAYKVIHNCKSEIYYKEMSLEQKENEDIIILVEKKIGVIASNSQRLQLEFFIEQGIDNYHYENETPEFFAYLMLLNGLENKDYF